MQRHGWAISITLYTHDRCTITVMGDDSLTNTQITDSFKTVVNVVTSQKNV